MTRSRPLRAASTATSTYRRTRHLRPLAAWPIAFLFIVVACFGATHSVADRHCSPASEDYYNARTGLLKPQVNKEDSLRDSLANLESARQQSAICGCANLQTAFAELVRAAGDETVSVSDRVERILGARQRIDRLIVECHH